MAEHEPPGYDDWFDDPEPPTVESGRGNRASYDTPGETEEDVWVLPEDEARRARRGGRRGDVVIGGRALTTIQLAILGIAALAVIVALLAAFGALSGSPATTSLTTPTTQTTLPTTATTTTTPTVVAPTKTLTTADSDHAQVKLLQRELKSLGFLAGPADGVFGPSTQAAVEQFQSSRGLTADGVVGEKTLTALRDAALGG
ncbi:MAG: hypothetical protein QOG85_1345 [Gaiellaceae bacterium]|jgi:hypothetical protein|nr:hypothetical protein [Gaiellaceae bacterium]